MIIKNSPTSS